LAELMPSFYVPRLTLNTEQIRIEGEEFHHLSRVARHRVGDEVILNSGQGLTAQARIREMDSGSALLQIHTCQSKPPIAPRLAMAFSLLQNKHDEWIVEKATELGCISFYPFTSRRTVRQASANARIRFEKTALAAIKQCDNPYLPKINEIYPIEQAIAILRSDGFDPVILSERCPEHWLDDELLDLRGDIGFVVGPEGGFSEEEFTAFERLQIASVRVSPLVLRAETAALSAAAQFNLLHRIR